MSSFRFHPQGNVEALAQLDVPDHKTAVEIPAELLRFAPTSES
jgi:hypothetical protein